MANLPMDIINDVFLRLPATTLVRCLVLSKTCFSLINSPHFIASHLKRTLETGDHLMILLRSPFLLRTVHLDAPDKFPDVVGHPLFGFTNVFGSVNGVIGLANSRTNSPADFALYNPSTRKIHRLPVEPIDFPERFEDVFHGLGYDSVSDDYKVVRMIQSKYKDGDDGYYPLEIEVFSLKSDSWKRIVLRPEVLILFNYDCRLLYRGSGVLASNSLHWILSPDNMIRFDLASDALGVLSFPQDLRFETMHLGVLDGCLCLMWCNSRYVDVWILREYGGEWCKFFTMVKPETLIGFEIVRPLIFAKDKSKVLMDTNYGNLVWFDLASKSFETLGIMVSEGRPCNVEVVVSSLVLGCKGVPPRRAGENEIMQEDVKCFLTSVLTP